MKNLKRKSGVGLRGAAACWLLMLALSACATTSGRPLDDNNPPGTWHVVKAGETSIQIARDAGIPIEDLLEINGLRRGQALEPGRLVFVLRASAANNGNPSDTPNPAEATTSDSAAPASRSGVGSMAPLRWPLAKPVVTSLFGKRWGRDHEGIDMRSPVGTPVLAAADGDVVYSGDQVRGYGNMVVVQHAGSLLTVYAHNSLLMVRAGDHVVVGQEIARAGSTGRSTAPHLHFEVRQNEVPQDPLPFLPALK